MATQGPNSPGTTSNVDRGGRPAWSNPGNIVSSNDSYATVTLNTGEGSDWLVASNFGFSIPSTATIAGIRAEYEQSDTRGNETYGAKLFKTAVGTDGTATEINSLSSTTSDNYAGFGGASYLWGTTWTPAQINASTFGVAIYAEEEQSAGSTTFSIDHVRVTITYTLPTTGRRIHTVTQAVKRASIY